MKRLSVWPVLSPSIKLRFKRGGVAFLLLTLSLFAWSEEPAFRNPENFDVEYELDRLANEIPGDWKHSHRGSPTGILLTGGSLNIRHLFIEEDIKFRVPLSGDRFGFRFRRERRFGLERADEINHIDLEGRVGGPWWLSLVGQPTFHKSDATLGVAGAWRRAEDKFVKVTASWPRFDTNYAFSNTSINEGYSEGFRTHPFIGRIEAVWQDDRTDLFLDATYSRRWELARGDLDPASSAAVEQAGSRELRAEFRRKTGVWVWSAEGQYWLATREISSDPPDPQKNRSTVQERTRVLLAVDRGFPSGSSLRLRLAPAASRGLFEVPGNTTLNDGYKFKNRIASLGYLPRFGANLSGEVTYLIDLQKRVVTKGFTVIHINQTQNRGTLALRWRMGPAAALAVLANIELDPDQGETFFSFDGGGVQFQAGLP